MPLLLLELGTADYADGRRTSYALLDGTRVVDVLPAVNPDEALVKGRELSPDGVVECEPALDAVATRRRATTRPLSGFEKMAKAHLACSLFEAGTYRSKDGLALIDFFECAYIFANAVRRDARRQWNIGARVRGIAIETAVDRHLVVVVVPGGEPKLYVVSEADAREVFTRGLDLLSVDHVTIDFRTDNPQLAGVLEDAYGLTTVPIVAIVERGVHRAPDNLDFEVLAPLLGLVGRYVVAAEMGFVYTPRLGGELAVSLVRFEPGATAQPDA